MAGVSRMHYWDLARICFLHCPTTLKAWQALYLRDFYVRKKTCLFDFFRYRFLRFFGNPGNTHKSKIFFLLGDFWEPFGSLRATFGRLLVTKVPQRLPKGSQKRPNGSKAPQKGFEKTTWLAFLNKLNVFSTIFSFSLVLAFIWLLFALIGSC